ncbi:PD-(D/E)XK nuclease family protein [Thermoflavifilum thermophilum]|nr:PD-(D/E)XK nuclease family protein [Thermoflavifilum thermophilum]
MDCYLEGKYDALIEFDDQTYGVVDFKASKYSQGKEETYKRQLQAYQYAFLHPQNGQQRQISKIGLLFLYPNNLQDSQNSLSMSLTQHWIEILYDENDFLTFIHEVQDLLSSPKTPPPTKDCPYCKFVSETSNL